MKTVPAMITKEIDQSSGKSMVFSVKSPVYEENNWFPLN
jgi:hypothetical protein